MGGGGGGGEGGMYEHVSAGTVSSLCILLIEGLRTRVV